MKQITIDCRGLSKEGLHRALAESLNFPDWYGNNLDALYDTLTAIEEDIHLTLVHFDDMKSCRRGFLRVFTDAMDDNPHLDITIA